MLAFFWKKGFYVNRQLFFFDEFFVRDFFFIYGISDKFLRLWQLRSEGFLVKYGTAETKTGANSELLYSKLLLYKNEKLTLDQFDTSSLFLLNVYLMRTLPVILHKKVQLKFNIWFYFLTRTYKGFSLKFSKPLHRRTRHRTYCKFSMAKPKNNYYNVVRTAKWF